MFQLFSLRLFAAVPVSSTSFLGLCCLGACTPGTDKGTRTHTRAHTPRGQLLQAVGGGAAVQMREERPKQMWGAAVCLPPACDALASLQKVNPHFVEKDRRRRKKKKKLLNNGISGTGTSPNAFLRSRNNGTRPEQSYTVNRSRTWKVQLTVDLLTAPVYSSTTMAYSSYQQLFSRFGFS